MTITLVKIETHPQEVKQLISIDSEQFLALVAVAEQRHLQKQAKIEIKIKLSAIDGNITTNSWLKKLLY